MTRVFSRYLSPEMVLLCFVELGLSFVVIDALLVPAPGNLGRPVDPDLAALLAFTIAATGIAIGLYRPQICLQWRRLLSSTVMASLLAFPAILLLSETLNREMAPYHLTWTLKVLLTWIACLLTTRIAFGSAVRHRLFARPLLIIGSGPRAARVLDGLRSHAGFFELAGTLDPTAIAEGTVIVPEQGRRLWGVVLASDERDILADIRSVACGLEGVRVLDDVRFWEQHLGKIDLDYVGASWRDAADREGKFQNAVKRASDVLISLMLLVFTLPLMLLVALLIKVDTPGSVFYRQERVGLQGRRFMVLKFRSMRIDAEHGGEPRWAMQRDPRVTRVGAFIRATRIDELPQLLNVLRGEMSFVGPRPERPHFVEQLQHVIPLYSQRACVKPGITGWAQVNYPYGASVEDARQKLAYDLYYVKNRGFFLDLLILISTIRVILFQEGAR
ncbi:MAG: exopolysaccharide biosynthesis polyprenyl glycosylphosphotransferase [Acetobacteraceae bacterium]|nr:exopolysaccharide biosynthesis polyprenyl glycosylphosphotransferase [Acetobacteraceae bacterium]